MKIKQDNLYKVHVSDVIEPNIEKAEQLFMISSYKIFIYKHSTHKGRRPK